MANNVLSSLNTCRSEATARALTIKQQQQHHNTVMVSKPTRAKQKIQNIFEKKKKIMTNITANFVPFFCL